MCTVTIIPQGENNFVLTSNRDEAPDRESLPPEFYTIEQTKMLFPKDGLAGGTWIGVSDKNRMLCVLNGGYAYHERKTVYRISRGIVAKDLLGSENLNADISSYNFHDIEPFTMVLADWNGTLQFMELVWDGTDKHFTELPREPRIWSSSTLYSKAMKDDRKKWFVAFKKENHHLNAESLMRFHKTAGFGNHDYGVIMDRGFVKTTSITQVEKQDSTIVMRYDNLKEEELSVKTFKIPEAINE